VFGKLLLVKLEVEDKAETIPLELLRTAVRIGKLSNRITYGPRSGEGRREMSEGIGVFARDLRGCLPVIECKPESNLLLESDVADKNRPVEGSRSGFRKGQSLDVDVGVGVGGVGELSGLIGIDDREQALSREGRWAGRLWEGES
jgi:hypothetical protein